MQLIKLCFLGIFFFSNTLSLSLYAESSNKAQNTDKLSLAILGGRADKRAELEKKISESDFLQVVDKKHLDQALKNLGPVPNGKWNEDLLSKLGKSIGTNFILYFDESMHSGYKLFQTETGKILASWNQDSQKSRNELYDLLETKSCLLVLTKLVPDKSREIVIANLYSNADSDDDGIFLGEEIKIDVTVLDLKKKKGVYLTILVYQSDGLVVQLFPNRLNKNNKVETGKELRFPPDEETSRYKFTAEPPAGEDTLIVIASSEPIGLPAEGSLGNSDGVFQTMNKGRFQGTRGISVKLKKLSGNYDVKQMILRIKKRG